MCPQGNPRPGDPLAVVVAGVPSADSDAAIARFLERFLADERPGTSWHASERRAAA